MPIDQRLADAAAPMPWRRRPAITCSQHVGIHLETPNCLQVRISAEWRENVARVYHRAMQTRQAE